MPQLIDLGAMLDAVLLAEGAEYTNYPSDKGGPTKYGITLKTLRTIPFYAEADAEDVKNLTPEAAKTIYSNMYVTPFLFVTNPIIFKFLFNGAVQHGVAGMVRILQSSMNIPVDGILGQRTKAAVLARSSDSETAQIFLARLVAARCNYYADILHKNESQRVFAAGWMRRIAKDLT